MIKAYEIFILLCFLFFFGAVVGWVLELFFRRFISGANPERKWLNPGFLTGPYLPLYGFGVIVLYSLSYLEKFVVRFDAGGIVHYLIMFVIMALAMTLLEYIAGIIFIKGMHIKLWDYSDEKFNIQGVICLRFTIIWGVLSLLYYFFIYPPVTRMILWFMDHQLFSFVVGMFFGVFAIDCVISMNLGAAMRKKAKEIDLKATLDLAKFQSLTQKKFFSVYHPRSLTERITEFEEFIKRSPDKVNNNKESVDGNV